MAGSVSITQEYFARKRAFVCKCVSDGSGDANGVEVQCQGGTLYAISFVPGAGCSASWDLTLPTTYTKQDGTNITWADITSGEGTDLSNSTNGGVVNLSTPFPIIPGSKITPTVAGLGATKTVHVVMHVWEEIS